MSKKTYAKHYVKRNPATLKFEVKGEKPVVGDYIRSTRITDAQAEILNDNSLTSGYMWVEVKEEIKPKEAKVEDEKSKLWDEIDKLVAEGKVKKPHHATGEEKLKKLIEEAK